jgi:diguanylate cyclase (GGDEF)-like protein
VRWRSVAPSPDGTFGPWPNVPSARYGRRQESWPAGPRPTDRGSKISPLLELRLIGLALLIIGALIGALTFSLIVGRYRARQLARLADRLANVTGEAASADQVRYPDPVLRDALGRLTTRIAAVEAMATTDPLTRIMNRQACLSVLASEIERANRYSRPLAVALIDIDHFKGVNDSHGHAMGDRMLHHVATVLRASARAVDSLGRYGGEEFILVMPETDVDGALASAENLRRVIARSPLVIDDLSLEVTISLGVTGGSGAASLDVDDVLRQADQALYTSKAQGRNQVQAFRPADDEARVMRATIDAAARARAAELGRAAFAASNRRLLLALSKRPGWAGGASQLIAELADGLARAVGLPDGDVERIRTASLLHDLGKLAIPDEILHKPAPLTADEWRTIIEHPKIGQVVLEQAGAIRDAAAIVLHHHEWFDGRGYPYGLAGAEIPLGSRIVAIADAYEAMISERPYKDAMSHPEALAELRRQRAVQFDPDLVDVFTALFARGIEPPAGVELGAGRR